MLSAPFSAKTPERLNALLGRFERFLSELPTEGGPRFEDMVFTLQTGREAFPHRLVILAEDRVQLRDCLRSYLDDPDTRNRTIFAGHVESNVAANGGGSNLGADNEPAELARAWVKGEFAAWHSVWIDKPVRTVSLPTYPFARGSYWFGPPPAAPATHLSLEPVAAADGAPAKPTAAPVPTPESIEETSMFGSYWRQVAMSGDSEAQGSVAFQSHDSVLVIGRCGALAEGMTAACENLLVTEPGKEPNWRSVAERVDRNSILWILIDVDETAATDGSPPEMEALFALTKGAFSRLAGHRVQLTYLFQGTDRHLPQYAWTAGLLATLVSENPRWAARWIHVDEPAWNAARLVNGVMAAWRRSRGACNRILFQDGKMFVAGWRALEDVGSVSPGFRRGGVYLITGGLGGLGLRLARYLAERYEAAVTLCGRSPMDADAADRLRAAGLQPEQVHYLPVDVTDRSSVDAAVDAIRAKYVRLDGVIVLRDGLFAGKSWEDFRAVTAPKIQGTLNLDAATADLQLEQFILFSSLSALKGNPGQADYAAANTFVDAFAHARNLAVREGTRHGRTLAINWPYWAEGGMRLEPAFIQLMRAQGLSPLPSDRGLEALERALSSDLPQVAVLHGDAARVRALMAEHESPTVGGSGDAAARGTRGAHGAGPAAKTPAGGGQSSAEALVTKTLDYLRALVGEELHIDPDQIEPGEPLEAYGLDSLLIKQFTDRLESILGPVSKALFFENRTLRELASSLAYGYAAELTLFLGDQDKSLALKEPISAATPADQGAPFVTPMLGRRSKLESDDIAIIGMAGRYPQADDLDRFWKNLCAGANAVTEVPAERWDHDLYFDPKPGTPGKTYGKWGAFLDKPEAFDAGLFQISPNEAAFMDPQGRLFLETVWTLFEDAGYSRAALADSFSGPEGTIEIGVFAGVTWDSYQLLGAEAWARGERFVPNASIWSIPNRVSYFFDLSGPSIAVDTACSSSLVAVHQACESIRRGDCQAAVAGGVNLYLHPSKYVTLAQARFLSSDGQCRSFGAGGDGFTPGEGVGAILLKPLDRAEAEGDNIQGVIKGSAVNHGGRMHGYTVPNPKAQASLIIEALNRAGVSAEAIDYVEAHGTGTALGDPVEIAGLTKAFKQYTARKGYCALGSVKSNIGHLESAAGIAGLTKVLLQMRHKTLVPTLHSDSVNPDLDLEATPFVLNHAVRPWPASSDEGNVEKPLVAGISSFGAGGVNAHVIVESPPQDRASPRVEADSQPELIIVSARDEVGLGRQVARLIDFFRGLGSNADLMDAAYSLQIGRDALGKRLAILARSVKDVVAALESYLEGQQANGLFVGPKDPDGLDLAKALSLSDKDGQQFMGQVVAKGDLTKLARIWVSGIDLDWRRLPRSGAVRRISLPTYAFDRKPCWFWARTRDQGSTPDGPSGAFVGPHPLIDRNVSNLDGFRFEKRVDRSVSWIADASLDGRSEVPPWGLMEIARAAVALVDPGTKRWECQDCSWQNRVILEDAVDLAIRVRRDDDGALVTEIVDPDDGLPLWSSRSVLPKTSNSIDSTPDLRGARRRCRKLLRHDDLYQGLSKGGLTFAASLRGLKSLVLNDREAVAFLQTSPGILAEAGFEATPATWSALWQTASLFLEQVTDEHSQRWVSDGAVSCRRFASSGLPDQAYVQLVEATVSRVGLEAWVLDGDGQTIWHIAGWTFRQVAIEAEPKAERVAGSEAVEVRTPGHVSSELQQEMVSFLLERVASLLGTEAAAISPQASLEEMGFSSIQGMQLIQDIQARTGMTLYASELMTRPTISSIAEYLGELHGRQPSSATDEARSTEEVPPRSSKLGMPEVTSSVSAPLGNPATDSVSDRRCPVFLISAPRSGSTLLRVMLGGHTQIFSPPELHLLPYDTIDQRSSDLSGTRSFLAEGLTRALMELHGVDPDSAERI
jgi:polyketide synthase PksN